MNPKFATILAYTLGSALGILVFAKVAQSWPDTFGPATLPFPI